MSELSIGLLDIIYKYNWQIVDRQLIEIVPNEREDAWKDLFILMLRNTPQTFRKNINTALLKHFDYKQPIYYNIKRQELSLATKSVLYGLNPPSKPIFASKLISPTVVVAGFILIVLSCLLIIGGRYF
nr:pif-6 [Darna trima granulovirus]